MYMFCEYFAYIYLWLVSNGDIGCYITDLAHLGEKKIKQGRKKKEKGKRSLPGNQKLEEFSKKEKG